MSLIGKEIGDFKVNAFHNGEVSWIEEEQAPLAQCGLFAYLSDFTVVECVYLKITNGFLE